MKKKHLKRLLAMVLTVCLIIPAAVYADAGEVFNLNGWTSYGNVNIPGHGNVSAVKFELSSSSSTAFAFCLDINTATSRNYKYHMRTGSSARAVISDYFGGSGSLDTAMSHVRWVFSNSPIRKSGSDIISAYAASTGDSSLNSVSNKTDLAGRAAQLAIWHFINGIDPNRDSSTNDANMLKLYDWYVGSANTGLSETFNVSVAPPSNTTANDAGQLIGPYTFSTTESGAVTLDTSGANGAKVFPANADGTPNTSSGEKTTFANGDKFFIQVPATASGTGSASFTLKQAGASGITAFVHTSGDYSKGQTLIGYMTGTATAIFGASWDTGRGSLTINKKLATGKANGNQSFTFTVRNADGKYVQNTTANDPGYSTPTRPVGDAPSTFTVTVNNNSTNGSVTINKLLYGTYTVTETGSGAQYTFINFEGDKDSVTINKDNKSGSVTAVNGKLGTLELKKKLTSAYEVESSYKLTVTKPGGATQEVTLSVPAGATQSNIVTLSDLPYGTYTIKETDAGIARFSSISVSSGGGTVDGDTATVVIGSSSQSNTVTVTATNERLGTLKLNKVLASGSAMQPGTKFVFTLTGPAGNATSRTIELYAPGDSTGSSQAQIDGLPYGTYTLTEQDATGFKLLGYTYSGGSNISRNGNTLTFTISGDSSAKRTVSVTATNKDDTLIKAVKMLSRTGGNTNLNFTLQVQYKSGKDWVDLPNVTLKADGTIQTVSEDLPVGTQIRFKEINIPAGYALDYYTVNGTKTAASDGWVTAQLTTSTRVITIGAVNYKLAAIQLSKEVAGVTSPGNFEFTLTKQGAGGFSQVKTVTGNGAAITFDNLTDGTYTLTETKRAGYEITGATFTQGSGTYDPATGVITIVVSANNTNVIKVKASNGVVTGSLTLTKALAAPAAFDDDDVFTFVLAGAASRTITLNKANNFTATLSGLPLGNYTLTENAAAGYTLASISGAGVTFAGGTASFTLSDADANRRLSVSATATNTVLGKLYIQKNIDRQIGNTAPTFVFHAQVKAPGATDWTDIQLGGSADLSVTAGSAVLIASDLALGSQVRVKEVQQTGYNLTGYTIDGAAATADGDGWVTGTLGDTTRTITFAATNQQKSSIVLKKTFNDQNLDTNTAFTFTLRRGGTVVGSGSVKADGVDTLRFDNLDDGTYVLSETNLAGYELAGATGGVFDYATQSITVVVGGQNHGVIEVNALNRARASIDITKSVIGGLRAGDSDKKFNIVVASPTAESTLPVAPGATVNVTKDAKVGQTYTFTEEGLTGDDWYEFVGWKLNGGELITTATLTLTVTDNTRAITVEAVNRRKASLSITKSIEAGLPTEDTFTFTVTGPNSYSTSFSLGKDGTKALEKLAYGTYTITETSGAAFKLVTMTGGTYNASTGTLTITLGADQGQTVDGTVTATNRVLGSVSLTKVLEGEPNSQQAFTFIVNGDEANPVTVNPGQTVTLASNVDYGTTFTIVEQLPANGWYALSALEYSVDGGTNWATFPEAGVTVSAQALNILVRATNQRLGQLELSKLLAPYEGDLAALGLPEPTFTFNITYPDGSIVPVQVAAGDTETIEKLPYGAYSISEVAIDGYKLQGITINGQPVTGTQANFIVGADNLLIQVQFTNDPDCYLELVKIDAKTELPIAGVTLRLSQSADFAEGTYIDVVTPTGDLPITLNLYPGTWYVKEIATVPGYVFDPDHVETVQLVNHQTSTVTFLNDPVGTLKIIKVDADTGLPLAGAEFDIFDAEMELYAHVVLDDVDGTVLTHMPTGRYFYQETKAPADYQLDNALYPIDIETATLDEANQPRIYELTVTNTIQNGDLALLKIDYDTRQPLPGITFELFQEVPDQSLIPRLFGTSATRLVSLGTDITGADGKLTFADLKPGRYWLREIATLTDYILPTEDVLVIIEPGQIAEVTMTNTKEQFFGNLKIVKVDADTQQKLTGAVFNIYADEALSTLLATAKIDQADGVTLSGIPADVDVWVKEMVPPTGYRVDQSAVRKVHIARNVVNEVTFANQADTGDLLLVKEDLYTRARLAGAHFNLYADAAKTVLVKQGISDQDGRIQFLNLVPGTYYLQETQAPEGYLLPEELQSVQVEVVYGQTAVVYITNVFESDPVFPTATQDYTLLVAGAGLLLLALGVLLIARRVRKARA